MSYQPIKNNYTPKSISFLDGFNCIKQSVGFFMEVDEAKATKIITHLIENGKKIKEAKLGLDGDFRENNTVIFDGKTFFSYDAYRISDWAKPILMVYYEDGTNESYECWFREIQDKP
ncbi:hypothetical protein JSO59_001205 [Riemerella anatipestifer]|uniref:hypothetical protein n=1 Tax=Riemerella anatipestifer TaxID=34085 RepID=UPI0030C58A95